MLPLLFEFIGTFVFFYVIANVGQPIAIASALLGAIFFGASVSGAHYNPGVSFMMYLLNKINIVQLVQYVAVQCLAAASVVMISNSVTS